LLKKRKEITVLFKKSAFQLEQILYCPNPYGHLMILGTFLVLSQPGSKVLPAHSRGAATHCDTQSIPHSKTLSVLLSAGAKKS
jgi:hypothetical protein